MSNPRNTETAANIALAEALQRRHPDWTDATCFAERTRVLQAAGSAGKRPDIVVAPPRRQPVIVETEFTPASTLEPDALARLGKNLKSTGQAIESVLAVKLPAELQTGDLAAVDGAFVEYSTYSLGAEEGSHARWPEKGWLKGGVNDLADAIEHLSVSERLLKQGTEALEETVQNAAGLLSDHAGDAALERVAEKLHQDAGDQTRRMAAAICVSAFVFHTAIEKQEHIPPVRMAGRISKQSLIDDWNAILEVNYWPIFSIARDIVEDLPVAAVPPIMNRIAESVAADLATLGATTYHDLAGRMFQTLISDRKFLATFYTLPASACLLAELAVERLQMDWSDAEAVTSLRIADFACGTGALLSAAQRAVNRRYRRAGGNDADLHRDLMERVLFGADIMPAATHLTCSMLSGAHPSLRYTKSGLHTLPYGVINGRTHIGALDFLDTEESYSLFPVSESLGGLETESGSEYSLQIKDESFDLVIMNPPFTRPTNHEAGHATIPVPSFAGFGTSHDEQDLMSRKLKGAAAAFSSGHAGLASNFMDLAHRKLRPGGTLALVLPFSFTSGKSWGKAREALQKHYSDVHVLSIADIGSTARAFSADTTMAECLVVATKRSGKSKAEFSSLAARPSSLLEASLVARDAANDAVQGDILDAGSAGVRSASVIEAARNLSVGTLSLPRSTQSVSLTIVPLGSVAARGLVDRDINGGPTDKDKTGPPQGPFVKRAVRTGEVPTYPALWGHHAPSERRLVVLPDSCCDPRPDDDERAVERWNRTASRLHSNRDFGLNCSSLAMCITPETCIGGRAWPNVIPHEERHEIPLLLWSNTTLGLIIFWWRGTRQHPGRACITITKLPDLPVLDARTLSQDQLDRCDAIFDDFKERDFLPANEAWRDDVRKELDRTMLFGPDSVLGLDASLEEGFDVLREQWCREPSVHGGKKGTYPGASEKTEETSDETSEESSDEVGDREDE